MKVVRLIVGAANRPPVLVTELPRRDGRGEAVVVGGNPDVMRIEFDCAEECTWFVQGFNSLSAADAVADAWPPRIGHVS